MSDSSKAVFLSYASQDAEVAKRICESLRHAGVEVWFDQNEPHDALGAHGLVGGDARFIGVIRGWLKSLGRLVSDGNERAGIAAALVFLETNGVSTDAANHDELYEAMIGAANRTVSRDDMAGILRAQFSQI